MSLEIYFSNETENDELSQYFSTIQKLYEYTLKHVEDSHSYEVSVNIVNEEMIQNINRDYRLKDTVTDVISFAFLDDSNISYPEGMPIPLGEIYICDQRMYDQAVEYKHSVERELHFLALHGFLHLLGYDHLSVDDERIMFQLQDEILVQLGYERMNLNE